MCELVTPMIRSGGTDVVYVMPNLQPPITTVSQARQYYETLTRLAPDVRFLMSLFLNSNMTPETIEEAKKSGIVYGVSHFFSLSRPFIPQCRRGMCIDRSRLNYTQLGYDHSFRIHSLFQDCQYFF